MDLSRCIRNIGVGYLHHRRGAVSGRNFGLIKTDTTFVKGTTQILAVPAVFIHDTILFGCGARFFAAPAKFQVKASSVSKGDSVQQVNENIRANVIRLITNEGNQIISRQGALQQAKIHKLDLVMVQSNANPPVCKLMDFNKEKYRQQIKEKERAKIKSSSGLKSAGFKEIKFSAKTEVKDLKMKAEMIKKLLDRGHRVRCTAVSINRHPKDEDDRKENLVGLLENLSAMLAEVATFENDPILDKRQAFFIVRHKKFGPLKKGGPAAGKKASKTQEEQEQLPQLDITMTPTEVGPKWSVSTTSQADFDHIFDLGDAAGVDPPNPDADPPQDITRPRVMPKIESPGGSGGDGGRSFGIFSSTTVTRTPSDVDTHEKEDQKRWGIFSRDK